MYENLFTNWMRWVDREQSEGIQYPGIYICAITGEDLSSKDFSWVTNIVYVCLLYTSPSPRD